MHLGMGRWEEAMFPPHLWEMGRNKAPLHPREIGNAPLLTDGKMGRNNAIPLHPWGWRLSWHPAVHPAVLCGPSRGTVPWEQEPSKEQRDGEPEITQSQLPKRALRAHPSLCILRTLVQAVCFKGVVLEDTTGAMLCKDRHLFHLEINLLL